MKLMDIGEVARQTGLPPSTLRHYESKALIVEAGRKGLRRQYAPSVVARIALISLGQRAGFSLDEIKEMLPETPLIQLDRDRLHSRADDIETRIKELRHLANALRHTADCSAPSHSDCPTFQRMMRAALKRPRKPAA